MRMSAPFENGSHAHKRVHLSVPTGSGGARFRAVKARLEAFLGLAALLPSSLADALAGGHPPTDGDNPSSGAVGGASGADISSAILGQLQEKLSGTERQQLQALRSKGAACEPRWETTGEVGRLSESLLYVCTLALWHLVILRHRFYEIHMHYPAFRICDSAAIVYASGVSLPCRWDALRANVNQKH